MTTRSVTGEAQGTAATTDGALLLQLRGVTKRYLRGDEEVHALRDVDLDVDAGQFVVVSGPSGSGKSTLLHVAAGLDQPDEGTVTIAGTDMAALKRRDRSTFRRRNVGFVFQFFNLVPTLDAVKNVALPLLLDDVVARDAYERAEALLARLGVAERRHHKPGELSGGQMQRVAIARALVTDPSLVFADEPTGNLDSRTGADVLALLREAAHERATAVVLVTHERGVVQPGDVEVSLQDGVVQVSRSAPAGH